MSEHKLVEIPLEDLPKLKDLYKREWPKFIYGHYTIDTFIRWRKNGENVKIFCLNGDWEMDGTFIVKDEFLVHVDTLDESSDSLKILLSLANLKEGEILACFSKRLMPIISEFLRSENFDLNDFEHTYSYYMCRENVMKLEGKIFNDINFKPLTRENVAQINSVWPYRRKGSFEFFEKIIRNDCTLGAFSKNGELIGWCLRRNMGSLGMLQVEEKFTRQGYGTKIAIETSKLFAGMGYDVTADILNTNIKSLRLFEKLGFEKIDENYWMQLKRL